MVSNEEIEWIKRLGFPYDKFPDFGNFLIAHHEVTLEFAHDLGTKRWWMFADGLPRVKDLIKNTDDLSVLVELTRASGEQVDWVVAFGLPAVKHLIKNTNDLRDYCLILVELAQASGKEVSWVFQYCVPKIKHLIRNTHDLRDLIELVRTSEKQIGWILDQNWHVVKNWIKNINDLYVLVELAQASGEHARYIFSQGLPQVKDLIKNTDDLRVLVELTRASGEQAENVFRHGLPAIKDFIKNTNDLRNYGLVLVELASTSGKQAGNVFRHGLPAIKHLIKNTHDLHNYGLILDEFARASEKQEDKSFWHKLSEINFIKNTDDLQVLVDLAKISGKYLKLFLENKQFLKWYINKRRNGNNPFLTDCLTEFNRMKFPGLKEEMYAKIDPRLARTENAELSRELLEQAQEGRTDFRKWYEEFNAERIATMQRYGINTKLWLGKKRFKYKEMTISVVSFEKEKVITEQLPQLKYWLEVLLDHINDPKYVLAEIISKLPKQPEEKSINGVIQLLQPSPRAIPAFIRDIIFNIINEHPDITSIPEKNLRKLINTFYGKKIGMYKAKKENSEYEQNELNTILSMSYNTLIKTLPDLKVMPYLQTRLNEFTKASPKPGKEQECSRALHELERIAQTIINIISSEQEEQKTHFEGNYDLRFRISDKFPTEVLTIGEDGHAYIAPGRMAEKQGHNFFRDVDALLVEILSMKEQKSIFKLFRTFDRIGFSLVFACVDDNGKPVLALNTVELPKLWPDQIQAKFYDSLIDWLKTFARKAGFKSIMIGHGYGSAYFKNKYGEKKVYFKKMNPYPTQIEYYTNAFDKGKIYETPTGLVLEYEGPGAIIWEK